MDVRLGDVLVMKKPHPCGSKEWKVLRTGMDFRLKCLGCGHEVLGGKHPSWKRILRKSAMQKNDSLERAKKRCCMSILAIPPFGVHRRR